MNIFETETATLSDFTWIHRGKDYIAPGAVWFPEIFIAEVTVRYKKGFIWPFQKWVTERKQISRSVISQWKFVDSGLPTPGQQAEVMEMMCS